MAVLSKTTLSRDMLLSQKSIGVGSIIGLVPVFLIQGNGSAVPGRLISGLVQIGGKIDCSTSNLSSKPVSIATHMSSFSWIVTMLFSGFTKKTCLLSW